MKIQLLSPGGGQKRPPSKTDKNGSFEAKIHLPSIDIYVRGYHEKKSGKKSQKLPSYVNLKNHRFLAKFSSGDSSVESFFCTKSSIKWANLGQLTPKMALMKDYTSVLNIMKPKLGQRAKKISKKGPKEKKSPQNFSKFGLSANFETLFRGLIPVHLMQNGS